VATFHGIPGADPPGAQRRVEHVLRVCVVAGVLGVIALAVGWLGWLILGAVAVIALDLAAPRLVTPAYELAGVPAGRLPAFSLWRHRRRILAADRANRRKLR